MSEICLECLNEIKHTNDSQNKYVLSKNLELCEECGQMKHIIIREHICYDIYPRGLKWLCKLIDLFITLYYDIKYTILDIFDKIKSIYNR